MADENRFPRQELTSFAAALLQALEVPGPEAAVTAACLVRAHLRGFDTHGLPCLPGYAECLREGRIKARPEMKVDRTTAWSFRLDADNGLGQVAAHRGMSLALEAAAELGVGGTVVRRSNHFGAASAYSLMALEKNCLGLVTSNASPATAPFGAAQPLMGTNPLSVAVPGGRLPPFVIDMATSEAARKKVRLALDRGQTIPPGWALDGDGNPTVDPARALEGVMLPFGGMKGSAISLLLDILSGVLSGARFGGDVLNVYTNQDRESGNGHFFLAFRIDSFMPEAEFKARMDEELGRVLALQPAQGFSRVIYPGFQEQAIQDERDRRGIPLEPKLMNQLSEIARDLGVELPWRG